MVVNNKEFFKTQLQHYKKRKFQRLQKQDKWPDNITKEERIWLIFFAKTQTSLETYLPWEYDERHFKQLFMEAYWTDPITGHRKWKDNQSTVNNILEDYRKLLEDENIDWKRLQKYTKPLVKECNYCPTMGHTLCMYQATCTLKL